MDGVDPSVLQQAEAAAATVDGVLSATARARWTGRQLRVDITATLADDTLLGDAAHTGRHIEQGVFHAVPEARTVEVFTTTA
jgi:divalent metal cation (Fe/Co/Zn/Cd) transporter